MNLSNPTICDLAFFIGRGIYIFIAASSLGLVFMIAYGAWKSSMALGDPKGLDAAKKTWTYALYGFLVIILFTTVITVVANLLGFTMNFSYETISSYLAENLAKLFGSVIPLGVNPDCSISDINN